MVQSRNHVPKDGSSSNGIEQLCGIGRRKEHLETTAERRLTSKQASKQGPTMTTDMPTISQSTPTMDPSIGVKSCLV
jgi:hypothetical protein